jgi:hypothetical protein
VITSHLIPSLLPEADPQRARVEISETTAAAPVANEAASTSHRHRCKTRACRRRSCASRSASTCSAAICGTPIRCSARSVGWDKAGKPQLEFLIRTIQKSSPYMPRGGYARKTPNAVVKAFVAWLENQSESLRYDMGEQSARREIILASGGIHETLRVLLFALSSYLEITPARVLCYRYEVLPVPCPVPRPETPSRTGQALSSPFGHPRSAL